MMIDDADGQGRSGRCSFPSLGDSMVPMTISVITRLQTVVSIYALNRFLFIFLEEIAC